jgi:hypothetical protein
LEGGGNPAAFPAHMERRSVLMGNKKGRYAKVDLAFQVAALVFFAVVFFVSGSMPRQAGQVPRLLCGVGALLSLLLLATTILKGLKAPLAGQAKPQEAEDAPEQKQGTGLLFSVISLLAYVAGCYILGCVISSFLAFAGIPLLLGYQNKKVCISYSAVLTVALYVVFVQFFMVRLPAGVLIDLIGGAL